MSYSGSGFFIYWTLIVCIFLPIDVMAEPEPPVSVEVTQDITLDSIDTGMPDDNETDEDESDDESETCPENKPDKNNIEKPFFSFLESTHQSISSGVELMARNIDEYFTENGDIYDSSGSYLRLRQNIISREGGIVETTTDTRFKLRLPNTQKKLKLFFETSSEKEPEYISSQIENTPTAEIKDGDSILGLQADTRDKYGFKFKPTVGVRLGSNADIFVKFRFRKEKEFTKWNLKWHETLQWYDSIGWGVDSYFELNKKIHDDVLFRSSTFARWTNEEDQFDLSQVFSLYHVFNKKKAISYYAGAYGVSEPVVYATQYLLGANYRQNIYKDYLFIEIEPQIRYQKINEFHAEHSLTFRLEVLFKK